MHAMEKAVERLGLNSGDTFLFSFKGQPQAGIAAVFKDILCGDNEHIETAVILVDLPTGDNSGKMIHAAIDIDALSQIGEMSNIETPVSSLHTIQ